MRYYVGFSFKAGGAAIWKESDGWHFDGPAGCGPRAVRYSGRGPYWRGSVSAAFAGAFMRAAKRLRAEAGIYA